MKRRRRDAALARHQRIPQRSRRIAQRRNQPEAGDDNAAVVVASRTHRCSQHITDRRIGSAAVKDKETEMGRQETLYVASPVS